MTQPFSYTTDGFNQARQWIEALLSRGLIKAPHLKRESGYHLVQWANDFYLKFGDHLNRAMKSADRIRGKASDIMVFDEAVPFTQIAGRAGVAMLDMSKLPEWDDFREEEELPPRKAYAVWNEGHRAQGSHCSAQFLGTYRARSFKKACKMAMIDNEWDMETYYDEEKNTFWACRFFDNEEDARASFG